MGVWWFTVFGETVGIPPEAMGFVFISFYVSFPSVVYFANKKNISEVIGRPKLWLRPLGQGQSRVKTLR